MGDNIFEGVPFAKEVKKIVDELLSEGGLPGSDVEALIDLEDQVELQIILMLKSDFPKLTFIERHGLLVDCLNLAGEYLNSLGIQAFIGGVALREVIAKTFGANEDRYFDESWYDQMNNILQEADKGEYDSEGLARVVESSLSDREVNDQIAKRDYDGLIIFILQMFADVTTNMELRSELQNVLWYRRNQRRQEFLKEKRGTDAI